VGFRFVEWFLGPVVGVLPLPRRRTGLRCDFGSACVVVLCLGVVLLLIRPMTASCLSILLERVWIAFSIVSLSLFVGGHLVMIVAGSEGHCQSFAALEEDPLDGLQVLSQFWLLRRSLDRV
jgi:hypothetical protein